MPSCWGNSMPKLNFNSDFKIGIGGLLAGCLILLVWIPLDVETGLIEKVRSQVTIGDAMAPSLAAAVLILGGLSGGYFLQQAVTQGGLTLPLEISRLRVLLQKIGLLFFICLFNYQ